jgi:hypothetical protein
VEGAGPLFLSTAAAQKAMCNCVNDLIFACEEATISQKTFMQGMLAIERQSELLGLNTLENCGLGTIQEWISDALAKKLPCLTKWIGVMSYSDNGSQASDCSDGIDGVSCTKTLTTALSFQADVETAVMVDESFPPFLSREIWTLKFFPQASGSFSSSISKVEKLDCASGSVSTIGNSNGANSGPLDLEAEFTFENGDLTDFNIRTQVSGDLEVQVSQTVRTTTRPCAAGSPSTSSTDTFKSPIYLHPNPILLEDVTFTQRTPTAVEGKVSGTWIVSSEISKRFSWSFSFRRNGP